MEIFEKLAVVILPILVGAFFTSIIPRKLKERQRFIEAATEFRKASNQILAAIQDDRFGLMSIDNRDAAKAYRAAVLNFRPYLHGGDRRKYDEIQNDLFRGVETYNTFTLKNDIEDLLTFTDRKMFRGVLYWTKRVYYKLRNKVFGPDKKTKELVEKVLKAYQDK